MDTTEIIGIAASVLVIISFLMKEIRVIRTISIISCIFFVVYGLLINALSIWLLNGLLIFVHIFFLAKSRKSKQSKKQSTEQKQLGEQRLQRFSCEAFDKKGLRSIPWFITSDLD